jgi:hypothetical protein
MRGKPLYTFSGCRLNIEGQEVLLVYTPYSHKPESERVRIDWLLARLRKKQPVVLVYVKFDETTLRVIDPPEWKEAIESRALPGSILHSVLKDLPIYEDDLLPESS